MELAGALEEEKKITGDVLIVASLSYNLSDGHQPTTKKKNVFKY
jgi:hypothetical protein